MERKIFVGEFNYKKYIKLYTKKYNRQYKTPYLHKKLTFNPKKSIDKPAEIW